MNFPHKRLKDWKEIHLFCVPQGWSQGQIHLVFFYIIKLSLSGDKFAGSDRTVQTGHPGQYIDDKVTVGRMVYRIFLEQEKFSREENSSNYYFEEVLGLQRNKEGKENPGNCASIFCVVFLRPICIFCTQC